MRLRIIGLICAAALWTPSFAQAFAVSPATLDISLPKGSVSEQTVTVVNDGAAEQTYYLGTQAFVPDVLSGNPQFISNDTNRSGLSGWIDFPVSQVVVPARTRVDVPFSIAVPSDAESGTTYAAVTVSVTPSEVVATNGASVEARLAVLVFLTVEGDTVAKIASVDFTTPDTGFQDSHAVSYAIRIQNQGNVSVKPNASIEVRDVLGRTVFTVDANPENGRVLPGTTRTFDGALTDAPNGFLETIQSQWSLFAIGPMTASLVLENDDAIGVKSVGYWYVPWQLLSVVVLTAALLWVAYKVIVRFRTTTR